MLKELVINNFKSHHNTRLELSNLNLFTGVNGSGKSSAFQALLLLRQTYFKNRLGAGLDLNSPLCNIGTAADALYESASEDSISLEIRADLELSILWTFDAQKSKSTFLPLLSKSEYTELNRLSLFNKSFQYLSASRWPPQESYPRESYAVEQERQISLEKGQGELIAHFLHYYGKEKVRFPEMLHPLVENDELLAQCSAWSREISKNVNIRIEEKGTDFDLKYNFNREGGNLPTHSYRSENVAFALTTTLPIIAAILSSTKDSILFFENPEAHLHPSGQAKLAELMALAAACGIQIMVETHSDHIVNGVLVACKKWENQEKGIDRMKVKIYHFQRDETTHASKAVDVPILSDGRLSAQPSDFFDQFDKDLAILTEI